MTSLALFILLSAIYFATLLRLITTTKEAIMRIHTDHNGVAVNAISTLSDGTDVEGHYYSVIAGRKSIYIEFQHGPVKDNGVNGLTNEALLAILVHRTKYLNDKFPCPENEAAISAMQHALQALEERTANRLARGVEGRHEA